MKNLLQKLFGRKNEAKLIIQLQTDELIGFWENDADDGSGLHAIWGYGIEFLEDGSGFNHDWGSEVEPHNRKDEIVWQRNGDKNISIRFKKESTWSTIEYEIVDFIGAYNSKYYKLVEKGKKGFWCCPNPIYKKIEKLNKVQNVQECDATKAS